MAGERWDVLVIGAGVAGLTAASQLAAAGHSVLLVDARDRIGGRVWTRHEPGLPAPVELGAEFIHGRIAATFELLSEAGKAALDTSGAHWTLLDGRLQQRQEELFGQVQQALDDQAASLRQHDLSFESFLADAGISNNARRLARSFVEGFDAADASRVSARSIAEEWGSGGMLDAPQFRPSGGYSSVLSALSGALDRKHCQLQLQTTVTDVRWSPAAVEMEGRFLSQPFRAQARAAIVTLPLGVLQAAPATVGSVRFTPALDSKRSALEGLASGPVLKVVLQFRSAFWEEWDEGRYQDASFFHSPDALFPTFWTCKPLRAPLLNAWVGGPKAARLCEEPLADIVRAAMTSLEAMFSGRLNGLELEAAYVHNWTTDPFARGAYSYVTVGGSEARRLLAAPLQDTLFFAGEATDWEGEAATVTGALHSGARVAAEVVKSLSAGDA